jgi:hypothetical protein
MMNKTAKACEKRPFVVIGGICTLQNSSSNMLGDFRENSYKRGKGAVDEDQEF